MRVIDNGHLKALNDIRYESSLARLEIQICSSWKRNDVQIDQPICSNYPRGAEIKGLCQRAHTRFRVRSFSLSFP